MCLCSLLVIAHTVTDLNSPFNKTSNASQALSNSLIALLFIRFVSIFQENDEAARRIAKEGQLMARELLQPHRLYCYYYKVLQVSTVDHFLLLYPNCYCYQCYKFPIQSLLISIADMVHIIHRGSVWRALLKLASSLKRQPDIVAVLQNQRLYFFLPPSPQSDLFSVLLGMWFLTDVGDNLYTTFFLFPFILIPSWATSLYYKTMNTWKRNSGSMASRVGRGGAGQTVIASLGDADL